MGFASLYPSYKLGTLEERANAQIQMAQLISHFRLNPDIARRLFRVSRVERFRSGSGMRHYCNNHLPKFRKANR
jgi:hypothetical protein